MSVTLGDIIAYINVDDSKALGDLRGFESTALGRISTFGKNLTLALGTALVGGTVIIGKFLLDAVGSASDLSETVSKTNIVFGENADQVLGWSESAAESFGLSQSAALSAAGTYGNLFRAMEIGESASADMSTNLVELAGDLASFNNMDPTEVLEKLRSGLSGETEPLKSLGININEALLKEKAFELGLWDGVGTLDAGAKAQAAYALMVEQTSLAQGDFARTSDGLANQQRILKAKFQDIKDTLGTALLPLITDMASRFNDFISRPETLAFIDSLAQKISDVATGIGLLLDGDIQGALTAIFGPEMAEKIMPTLQAIGDWVTGTLIPFVTTHAEELKGAFTGIGAVLAGSVIVFIISSIAAAIASVGAPVLLLIALAALLGAAWNSNWGGIQDKTRAAIEFIKGIINSGSQFINDLMSGRLGILSMIVLTIFENIKTIFAAFQAAFSGDWYRFGELLRVAWDRAWLLMNTILMTAWENIKTGVKDGIETVKNFFTETDWGNVGTNILQGIAKGITNGLSILRNAAIKAAKAALEAAKGFLGIRSPSDKFADEVGEPSAEGTGLGFVRRMKKMGLGMGESMLGAGGGTPSFAMPAMAPIYVNVTFDKPFTLFDEYEVGDRLRPVINRLLDERKK